MSDNSITDSFIRALNYYILLSGKTKKEIADSLGIPPTTFSSWCNGKHLPDMDKLQKLSDYTKIPVAQFFDFTVVETPKDPLLEEIMSLLANLSNEDKLLVRAVAQRLAQLQDK